VLYNVVPGRVAVMTNAMVAAIVSALDASRLSRSALETAVGRMLPAKSVNLCSA
jgi:hypothetical protein